MSVIMKKIAAIIVVLLGIAIFTACSSEEVPYEDLDIIYKGDIDEDGLMGFENGNVYTRFTCDRVAEYIRELDDRGVPAGDWKQIPHKEPFGVRPDMVYQYHLAELYIKNGCSWIPQKKFYVLYSDSESDPDARLYQLWSQFLWMLKSDENVSFGTPIKVNLSERTIELEGTTFDIESFHDGDLVISHTFVTDIADNGQKTVPYLKKYIFTCEFWKQPYGDFDDAKLFGSEYEMKLYIVRKMRDYFGDTFDPTKYPDWFKSYPPMDLAKYEENLLKEDENETEQ